MGVVVVDVDGDGVFLGLAFLGTAAFAGMGFAATSFSGFLVEVFWAFVAIDSSSCAALKS
ncbi:MAG: hypothetical protein AAFN74_02130 [Myxococcota bacterium]